MGGERPFDDDRWPDQEGFAVCFLCGRRVDPRDSHRGTYTSNASACEPLPLHLPCLDGRDMLQVETAFMRALLQMGDANAKRAREAARCASAESH
jgi:hypothetical protein